MFLPSEFPAIRLINQGTWFQYYILSEKSRSPQMLSNLPEVIRQRLCVLAGPLQVSQVPCHKPSSKMYKHTPFKKEDLFIFINVPLGQDLRKGTRQTIVQSLLVQNRRGFFVFGLCYGGQKGWVTGAAGYTGTRGSLGLLYF